MSLGPPALSLPEETPGNKGAHCKDVMAILEAEEFINMIQSLKAMELMEDEKAKLLIVKFMKKIGDELEIDLVSSMETNFATHIDKED